MPCTCLPWALSSQKLVMTERPYIPALRFWAGDGATSHQTQDTTALCKTEHPTIVRVLTSHVVQVWGRRVDHTPILHFSLHFPSFAMHVFRVHVFRELVMSGGHLHRRTTHYHVTMASVNVCALPHACDTLKYNTISCFFFRIDMGVALQITAR